MFNAGMFVCLFVCLEYGAPEEDELKEEKPFALKDQLLSESSIHFSLSLLYGVTHVISVVTHI